jgi:hypothetical protein
MIDTRGLQFRIEIESGSRHFRGVGRYGVVPCLARFLPEPKVDGFTGQTGRGYLRPLGLGPKLKIGLVWKGQMEVLHAISLWHGWMPSVCGTAGGTCPTG